MRVVPANTYEMNLFSSRKCLLAQPKWIAPVRHPRTNALSALIELIALQARTQVCVKLEDSVFELLTELENAHIIPIHTGVIV